MENILRKDLDYILDNTRALWEELRNKRIFITGGTGFFGCWLLESFLWANKSLGLNASMTALTRNIKSFKRKAPHLAANPSIQFHVGDIRSFDFPDGEYSFVIHASNEAAEYRSSKDAPENVKNAIILSAKHALDFAMHCRAQNFLFTSSGTVYGPQPSDLMHLPETYEGVRDASNFRFAHGEGKFIAETLCADYAEKYGLAVKIARCFSFVGPYMQLNTNYAIGNFIGNVIKSEPVIVKGDGTPYRSYLYAADLTIWLWTILFKGESGRPYNVGSEKEYTIAEIARTVADFLHCPEVCISEKTSRSGPAERYVPSVRRAHDELGLSQSVDLKNAIEKTISWLLTQSR
jgi:dTDP-glucose 4,6-dehydratase